MIKSKRVCFGIPSVFSFSSKTCATCGDFGHCRRLAHDELKKAPDIPVIRAALVVHERFEHAGVPLPVPSPEGKPSTAALPKARPSRAKRPSFELTEHQKQVIESVPVKVGDAITKLFKRGHDAEIRIALREGKTPLKNVPCYRALKVALKHLKKGYDRQTLRTYFVEELGWSYTSAWNEVSLTWGILPAIGVAMEKHGRLVVAPSVLAKNDCIE